MNSITDLVDGRFPSTRYTGSKRRLLPHLYQIFQHLEFNTAGDIFCGTSSVAYLLKKMGKQVLVNDYLYSNYWTGIAIIENNHVTLSEDDIQYIAENGSGLDHEPGDEKEVISSTFKDYYFTDEENQWLDRCRARIENFSTRYASDELIFKKALAYHALFQSALRKRPFNLFHRKNLYLRLANVVRQFGNASTWNRSFSDHICEMACEVNGLVYDNGVSNRAYCENANTWLAPPTDLIYLDPPYVWSGASQSSIDYLVKYHFLEGIARYDEWTDLIDQDSPLLAIKDGYKQWPGGTGGSSPSLRSMYKALFERYNDRTIVLSYRDNGIPTVDELSRMIKDVKPYVYSQTFPYKYALRKSADQSKSLNEIIFIGIDRPVSGLGDEL